MKVKLATINVENLQNTLYQQELSDEIMEADCDCLVVQYTEDDIDEDRYHFIISQLMNIAISASVIVISGLLKVKSGKHMTERSFCLNELGILAGEVSKEYDGRCLSHATEFPVFETKIGRIGIVISKDLWSIEIPRILVLKGAVALFAVDTKMLDNECDMDHIRGVSVFNCVPIIYTKKEADKNHLIVTAPKEEILRTDCRLDETLDVDVDIEEVNELRKPDLSFKNTLWWLLWGRRPDNYREIIRFGNEVESMGDNYE